MTNELWYFAGVMYILTGYVLTYRARNEYEVSWWEYPMMMLLWLPIIMISNYMEPPNKEV